LGEESVVFVASIQGHFTGLFRARLAQQRAIQSLDKGSAGASGTAVASPNVLPMSDVEENEYFTTRFAGDTRHGGEKSKLCVSVSPMTEGNEW